MVRGYLEVSYEIPMFFINQGWESKLVHHSNFLKKETYRPINKILSWANMAKSNYEYIYLS